MNPTDEPVIRSEIDVLHLHSAITRFSAERTSLTRTRGAGLEGVGGQHDLDLEYRTDLRRQIVSEAASVSSRLDHKLGPSVFAR